MLWELGLGLGCQERLPLMSEDEKMSRGDVPTVVSGQSLEWDHLILR